MKLLITSPYNTNQILKKELQILGYSGTILSPTSLTTEGPEEAIARINMFSRIANKVYIVLTEGKIHTFDELFECIFALGWDKYIAEGQDIVCKASSSQSDLHNISSIQSIAQKAIYKKLCGDNTWAQKHDSFVEVTIHLHQNHCYILLNTSGDSLHNRGYRKHFGEAPIKENLAAALVLSSGRKFSTPFIDPFCGSGTLCIEAALIAKNIAPGLIRSFAYEDFFWYNPEYYLKVKAEAESKVMTHKSHTIIGYDKDATMIEIAKDNAKNAGVGNHIEFSQRDFMSTPIIPENEKNRAIVTNPPYGERMDVDEIDALYKRLSSIYENNIGSNGGFISPPQPSYIFQDIQVRKKNTYFNGPIECKFYKIARH